MHRQSFESTKEAKEEIEFEFEIMGIQITKLELYFTGIKLYLSNKYSETLLNSIFITKRLFIYHISFHLSIIYHISFNCRIAKQMTS